MDMADRLLHRVLARSSEPGSAESSVDGGGGSEITAVRQFAEARNNNSNGGVVELWAEAEWCFMMLSAAIDVLRAEAEMSPKMILGSSTQQEANLREASERRAKAGEACKKLLCTW